MGGIRLSGNKNKEIIRERGGNGLSGPACPGVFLVGGGGWPSVRLRGEGD